MQMKLKGETHVACVHSGMDEVEKRDNIKRLSKSRFIYLSPEYICNLIILSTSLISTLD